METIRNVTTAGGGEFLRVSTGIDPGAPAITRICRRHAARGRRPAARTNGFFRPPATMGSSGTNPCCCRSVSRSLTIRHTLTVRIREGLLVGIAGPQLRCINRDFFSKKKLKQRQVRSGSVKTRPDGRETRLPGSPEQRTSTIRSGWSVSCRFCCESSLVAWRGLRLRFLM
jgi:hypothetical protein